VKLYVTESLVWEGGKRALINIDVSAPQLGQCATGLDQRNEIEVQRTLIPPEVMAT